MDQLLLIIQSNIQIAPYIIFGALLLAGFCLPISEDGMLFISAVLASKYPDLFLHFLLAVFLGAYFSDLICFTLGKTVGPKILKISFFSKMISQDKIKTVQQFYDKYGIITLIFGRFVPFGVRNALFLSAGIGKMNNIKFAMSDLLACSISTAVYFSLYYYMGSTVIEYVKKGNIVIFSIAIIVALAVIINKKRKKKNNK